MKDAMTVKTQLNVKLVNNVSNVINVCVVITVKDLYCVICVSLLSTQ